MSDELRERVAKYFCSAAEGKRWGCGEPKCWCYIQASGAIALIRAEVLEEAAKVAEMSWCAPNVMYYSEEDERKANSCAFEAAAAIRALKEAPCSSS